MEKKEEIMNNEVINDEETALAPVDDYEVYDEEEEGGLNPLIVGGSALVLAAGLTALVFRKRIANFARERSIRKLEREGYVVYIPEDDGPSEDGVDMDKEK